MPDFWLDSDVFIRGKNEAFGFDIGPGFWELLDQKASEGIIASPSLVYHELTDEASDDLAEWVRKREQSGLFVEPDALVQAKMGEIADYVRRRYPPHQASAFLDGADPWLVAHAKAYSGTVVTFERRDPTFKKAKIPDVADHFGVISIDLWQMLRELHVSFGLM